MYSIVYASCRELLRLNSPSEYDRSSEGPPYHHAKLKINNLSWECRTQIYKLSQIDTSLRIQDRAECGNGTEMGGGTPHRKNFYVEGGHSTYFLEGGTKLGWGKTYSGRGDTAHTLLMRGTIGVGTPHNIERKCKSLN